MGGVSVRGYRRGEADLSEGGGSVKGLFAHPAGVLLLARAGAGAFLPGCARAGGVCAGVADGLGEVRARRGGGRQRGRGGRGGEIVVRGEQQVGPVAERAERRRGVVGAARERVRRPGEGEGGALGALHGGRRRRGPRGRAYIPGAPSISAETEPPIRPHRRSLRSPLDLFGPVRFQGPCPRDQTTSPQTCPSHPRKRPR